ncbi:leucyl/phenylalanyl-tRNA--protein transferase [Niveibacterium sp. SC-1]|uniref:leucyl/phenylalanyl-tRNA--protein transferase n=1 Tax=Niveibacterium sp. SC-1 TaxID=3135646 RepID=UPI00311F4289
MIPWLTGRRPDFPPVAKALAEPNGLLAAGGRLEPEWLLGAYSRGIFPWYSPGDPLLWWSPDPRMVLFPGELRVRHSFAKALRNRPYEVSCDTDFEAVIEACAAPRGPEAGTWIVPEMQAAYRQLFELGWAHSVEVRVDGTLIGGLYGVALGRVFYGESMFSRERDGSKIALAHLARDLERRNFAVIDCQMKTAHLDSMGAREIPRQAFVGLVAANTAQARPGRWEAGRMRDITWRDA